MTSIDELSAAWNKLRNAALGRGTTPKVKPELAKRVGDTFEAWRRWQESIGPLDTLFAQAAYTDNLKQWQARGEALRAEVEAELGVKLPAFPDPVAQQVVTHALETVLPTVGLLVAAGVGLFVFLRRKR